MNHLPGRLFQHVSTGTCHNVNETMDGNLQKYRLSPQDVDRVIEMAWEDRTPFEAILHQFGLGEADTIALMRRHLKTGSFKNWRKRVNSGISQKHLRRRPAGINRFKCNRQRTISMNRISKR